MTTEQIINSVSIARLVEVLNACADPCEDFPYIMENNEDTADEIGERMGGYWTLVAVSDHNGGRYNTKDTYVICDTQVHSIFSFSTKTDLINYIGFVNLANILDENRENRYVAELFAEYAKVDENIKKTFVAANKHLCTGADYWSAHEITLTDTELLNIIPVEDRSVAELSIGETYINRDKDRIITRIA